MNIFGFNIRNRRRQIEVSQAKLAELMGYKDRSAISKIETGEISLPADKIATMAACLRCLPEELLGCHKNEYDIYRKVESIRTGKEMGI